MGGIPDVKPLYHTQLPTLGQTLTPQIQLLMSIMQDKQARKELANKLLRDRMAGNLLRDTIENVDSTLVPSPGFAAFRGSATQSGVGVDAFGQTAAPAGMPVREDGPVARAVRGQLGEVVWAAAPYLTGMIATGQHSKTNREKAYLDMIGEKAKALLDQGKPSFTHFVTDDYTMAIVDQNTGRGDVARYLPGHPKAGQPIPVAQDVSPGPQIDMFSVLDRRPKSPTFQMVIGIPKNQPYDPSDFTDLALTNTENARAAAGFMSSMRQSYKQTRYTIPEMSEKDRGKLTEVVGDFAKINQDQGVFTYITSKMTLDEPQTRWLSSMLDLMANSLYLDSGKAITVGEWNRRIANSMPNLFDSDELREEKWARLEARLIQVDAEGSGYGIRIGQKHPPLIEIIHQLRAENAVLGALDELKAEIRGEHLDPKTGLTSWTDAQVHAEAKRRYNATRPLTRPKSRAGGPSQFIQPRTAP
jgi:hypothetical protein